MLKLIKNQEAAVDVESLRGLVSEDLQAVDQLIEASLQSDVALINQLSHFLDQTRLQLAGIHCLARSDVGNASLSGDRPSQDGLLRFFLGCDQAAAHIERASMSSDRLPDFQRR